MLPILLPLALVLGLLLVQPAGAQGLQELEFAATVGDRLVNTETGVEDEPGQSFRPAVSMAPSSGVAVRVLLERVAGEVRYEVEGAHSGFVNGRLLFDTPLGIAWPIDAVAGSVMVDGTPMGVSFTLAPRSRTTSWAGREYRGALRFVASGDDLLVVNVVDLEEYLRGVVPAEMMAGWPLEALKAQAVASRTYTIVSLDPNADFDICATIDCQVYEGMASEHPRSDRAIAETAGLVLTYEGAFARTYYHADSGGSLASSQEVWGLAVPYLGARADVWATTPHRSWERRLDSDLFIRALAARGYRVGSVLSLRVTAYTDSGRARRAEISGTLGRATLSGATLTAVLREAGLKSTRFTMVGDLVARGDGWGHGVGMSQYGARSLAQSGDTFDGILRFYYPATLLQRLSTSAGLEANVGEERR
jgi:stage II sporulation protein D